MWDIADKVSVTPATVLCWMKKYNFKRRSSSESAYAKHNPNGDPFKIKNRLTMKDKELLLSGLILYWAEGSRKNKHTIQIANLDHRLILLFTKFLRNICGLRQDKLCLAIQLYRDYDKEQARNYWSRKLDIPKRFVSAHVHTDNRSKPNEQWSKNGIARLEIRNMKLKQWIDLELEKYIEQWN